MVLSINADLLYSDAESRFRVTVAMALQGKLLCRAFQSATALRLDAFLGVSGGRSIDRQLAYYLLGISA